MLTALSLLKGTSESRGRYDDVWADRLNHHYTVALLVSLSVIVTTQHLVGEKIQCLTPTHFSGSWQAYTDQYCWVKNTYSLPFEDNIPKEDEEKNTLQYYQWVPLIMQIQALLYFIPCVLWRSLNSRCGIDLDNLLKVIARSGLTEKLSERQKYIDHAVVLIHRFSTHRRNKNLGFNFGLSSFFSKLLPMFGRRRGNYLCTLFICIKFLYAVNAIGQIFLLNLLIGSNLHMYGIEAMNNILYGGDIAMSDRFPRVTMCDFKIFVLGNVQRYTVQCVLPINLFHEMIYLLIWFWMVGVATITVYSFIIWTGHMVSTLDRHNFMNHFVKHIDESENVDTLGKATMKANSSLKAAFTERYLRLDGVFLMHLVHENTDDLATYEIIKALWTKYCTKQNIELYPISEIASLK